MQGNQPGPYSYPINAPSQPQQMMYQPQSMMMGMSNPPLNRNQLDITTCLYVTELGPYETEQSLFLHFHKFGNLKYVKIPRACANKQSKYGFVYFSSRDEAAKVKKEAHYSMLGGKEIRVIHYKSMDIAEKEFNNEANLFYKNVSPDLECKAVEVFFNTFGEVTSCKLAKDQNGDSLRYGYIQFASKEAAQKCLENHRESCMEINSPELSVIQFIPRGQRPLEETTLNLYVRNLPISDKGEMEKRLKETFSSFGEVKSVVTNKAKEELMYAFVCFNDPNDAQNAINALNGADPFNTGVPITVELAKPRIEAANDPANMYTKNLKRLVGEPELRKAFGKYGEIESIAVRTVENFNTRSAFIKYKSRDDAVSMKMSSRTDPEIKDLYEGEVYIETFKNKKDYDLLKKSRQIRAGYSNNKMAPFHQMNQIFNQQLMMQTMMMNQGMMMGQGNPIMQGGRMPLMNPMPNPGMAMGNPLGNPQMGQHQGNRRPQGQNQGGYQGNNQRGRGGYNNRGGMRNIGPGMPRPPPMMGGNVKIKELN